MKLKKIFTTAATLIFYLSGIFAQSNVADAKSEKDFRRICENLSKVKVVRGDFELSQYAEKNGRTVNSSGKYTISASDGMIWFTKKPVESVMAITKNYIIQENKGRQRKMDGTKNPTFAHMANAISSLFTGNYEEIEKNFIVKCGPVKNAGLEWGITLTPENKTIASYIKTIKVNVLNKPDVCHILMIMMETVSGDRSDYQLSKQVLTDTLNSHEAKYFEK